jgi:hypothetical protein
MSTTALEALEVEAVDDKVREWRIKGFVDLDFTLPQAEKLADAKDELGFPVYDRDVAKLLARVGGDHALAFDLLT